MTWGHLSQEFCAGWNERLLREACLTFTDIVHANGETHEDWLVYKNDNADRMGER
jgi:hypothetical protein